MPDHDDTDSATGTRTGTPHSLSRRRLLTSMSATTVVGGGILGRTVADPVGADEFARRRDAAPENAVREAVWVETDVDTNQNGTPDRVYVRISRPERVEDGEQLPVIATASPYFAEHTHGDTTPEMLFDRRRELSASADGADETAATTSSATGRDGTPSVGSTHRDPALAAGADSLRWLERRYQPQGYVVAQISSHGTHESTGCYTAAGPKTAEALKAVVDWFNGRATAYDAKQGGTELTADWTNGKTGMTGTSANGELANAVATTGVDGLEAIVPNSANNGQYSLFRSNGTPVAITPTRDRKIPELSSWIAATNVERPDCDHWTERAKDGQDHETGDYNDFWHEREFLPQADQVEAAVLVSHTVDDPVVKPNNGADWYEMLRRADVPVKLWLHEGGHRPPRNDEWQALLDRWWAHWLKDEDNGVMDESRVTIGHRRSSEGDSQFETYDAWPVPDTESATVGFTAGGTTNGIVPTDVPDAAEESFVDDPSTTVSALASAEESNHRLCYRTPPLNEAVHVSGKVVPSLAVSFDDPTVVSVALVEYSNDGASVVTRGWADPLNRPSYGESDTPVEYKQSLRESGPVESGEQVRVEFPLQATDHVFESGTRIGLVVYASDAEFTLHSPGESTVTLSLGESAVDLPVVGGESALTGALPERTPDGTDARSTAATAPAGPTDTGTSDSGPGFGIGGALAALGGVGYGLWRRLGSDDDERK